MMPTQAFVALTPVVPLSPSSPPAQCIRRLLAHRRVAQPRTPGRVMAVGEAPSSAADVPDPASTSSSTSTSAPASASSSPSSPASDSASKSLSDDTSAASDASSISTADAPPVDGGASGSGNNSGSGGSDANSGDGTGGEPSASSPSIVKQIQETVSQHARQLPNTSKEVSLAFADFFKHFFSVVPPPIMVALISVSSTLSAARIKAARDAQAAESAKEESARKRRAEIEHQLRRSYADLADPILKSAIKLAERIHVLVDSEFDLVEAEYSREPSPSYSAYLLGRYLATVEIIKQENAVLDFGFPAADRIFVNVLGRVQGVLTANDDMLRRMQSVERSFRPLPGQHPLHAGPLRLTPRAQAALGELLLRRSWQDKYDFVDKVSTEQLQRGPRSMLSFLEFSRILHKEPILRKWYKPVIEDFTKIEKIARKAPRDKRRRKALGSRLYFLHSSLMDLVDFFDPMPYAKTVPYYRRKRLSMGCLSHTEEQRMPESLHVLYKELANMRDHHVVGGDKAARLSLTHGVEVFVKSSDAEGRDTILSTEHGDCPYSHRVLIVLKEMGVQHKVVTIPSQAKPSWFHLLHPENSTPVIYHEGKLVEDSKHIVTYLMQRFPDAKKLASADHLNIALGTASFTRFHPRFKAWLSGDETARLDVEVELRKLNRAIAVAQDRNDGQPFLGGDQFSREDTAIAPMLNNVDIAGRALKGWKFPRECRALRVYLDAARKVPSFASTVARDHVIVEGYCRLVRGKGENHTWLADMLE